jgi:hypothetical protein
MLPLRTLPGGVNQYVEWSPTASIAEHFFSDDTCREHYKRNALNLISRVNTFNGRRYRDDPTIFSWVCTAQSREQGHGLTLCAGADERAAVSRLRCIAAGMYRALPARHARLMACARRTGSRR